jgi:hypothetical protein
MNRSAFQIQRYPCAVRVRSPIRLAGVTEENDVGIGVVLRDTERGLGSWEECAACNVHKT